MAICASIATSSGRVGYRQALTETLRGIGGTQLAISSLGDASVDAVRAANDRALSALGAITSEATPEVVVQAMNLSVINFATGSDQLPAESGEVIRRLADAIKRSPAGSRTARQTPEGEGHGDTRPRATNDTEFGRFQNRRIEYAVIPLP